MNNKDFIKENDVRESELGCYATFFGFFALVVTTLAIGTIFACIPLVIISLIILFTGILSL